MSISDDIINGTYGTNSVGTVKKKKKNEVSSSLADQIIGGTYGKSNLNNNSLDTDSEESLSDRIIKGTYKSTRQENNITENNDSWFKRGALSDGYQKGDILKTVVGSAADIGTGITKGIMDIGEGIGDLITYGRAEVNQLQGNIAEADRLKKSAQLNSVDNLLNPLTDEIDKNSVFGNKSDSIIESLGYVAGLTAVSIASGGTAGALGAGTAGTTAAATIGSTATTFSTAMGNGLNQAYKDGAKDDDAWKYGVISGLAEAGSEMLFGGLGKASGAIGLGKGITSIDDVLAKKVSNTFKSTLGKNLSEYVIKSGAEGTEEVISGFIQAIGQKLTYKSEEDLGKLLKDQHLLEQFVAGTITSAIAQGPGKRGIYKTTTEGRDFITGMTNNETKIYDTEIDTRTKNKLKEKAIDKMYQGRIETLNKANVELNNEEKNKIRQTIEDSYNNGKIDTKDFKLNAKDFKEIEDQVKLDFEEGNIETNKIREILGENQDLSKDRMLQKSIYESNQKSVLYKIEKSDNEKINNLYQSAAEAGLNNTTKTRSKIELVSKLTKETNRQYKFASPQQLQKLGYSKEANGVINKETGEIYINSHSDRGIQSIIGHETTHIFDSKNEKNEYSEDYKTLQNYAIEYAKEKGIYNDKVKKIASSYESLSLDESQLKEELTADLVGDFLFSDEKFITQLSVKNRNVFQKIYDYIKKTIKSITVKDKETKSLENLKLQFEKVYKAIQDTNSNDKIKYSIKKNENGIQYVNVDTDQHIFDGKNPKDYPKIAKDYILNNFRDGNKEITISNEEKINVIKRTANEYSHPKNNLSFDKKDSKMKASTELDNLVKISKYQNSTKDDGRHSFAKDGWDYYKTIFKVNGKTFEGLVNIGKNGNVKTLYDITSIKEIPHISYGKNLPESLSVSPLVNNSITNSKEQVNTTTNNMQKSQKNSLTKEKLLKNDIPVKKLLKIEDLFDPVLKKNNINKEQNSLDKIIDGIKEINVKKTRHDVIQENRELARKMIKDIARWKDKGRGFLYSINTMKRNLRDIAGNEKGTELYNEYFKPITKNNAKIESETNKYNERIEKFNLNDIESTYVQMIGEAKYNPDTKILPDHVDSFYAKNKKKIDKQKCESAVEEFRKIYDELIEKVNNTLVDNGYKEIGYKKGYFPHFIEDKAETIIGKMAEKLGWKINKDTLPTDIAGITDQFVPGKAWTSFSQKRTGDATDYNALKGFDNYIRGAMDVIYHTNDIQKLRALEAEIRYQYSEKGIQEQIDKILDDDSLDMEKKYKEIEELTEKIHNPMGNLAIQLRTYTNSLANKKHSLDRGIEQQIGRDTYSIMTNIQNRVSANMVGANIGSAVTNFIPITQAWSQVSTKNLMKGMIKSIESTIKDDGFSNYSTFLINRTKKADRLYKTTVDKMSDTVGIIFEAVDSFTSNTIVRSKYYENLDKGMSEENAIDNADEFAKDIISGRGKGDQPTIFNSKNPLVRLFTAFQLEVNNQYGYMLKDLPHDLRRRSKR